MAYKYPGLKDLEDIAKFGIFWIMALFMLF